MQNISKYASRKNIIIASVVGAALAVGGVYEYGKTASNAIIGEPSVTPAEALASKGTDKKQKMEMVVAAGKEDPKWTNISCLLNSEADFRSPSNVTVAVTKSAGWTLNDLMGKKIVVSGAVTDYKGKSEIKVTDHAQITVEK